MSGRTFVEQTTQEKLRAAISDAYYDARNEGRTMESAADAATAAIVPILTSIDANAHGRGAKSLRDAFLHEADPSVDGTWREAVDLLDRLLPAELPA